MSTWIDSIRRFGPHRRVLPLIVATSLFIVVAGCTGGEKKGTLSKAEVISQGGAICRAAEQRVEKLPQLTSQHPFAKGTSPAERKQARRFLSGYADALDASREGLQKLNAPEQRKELLDGYIHDIGTVAAKLRAASKADPEEVEAQAGEAFKLFARASKQTAEYGFPKGVCGSGASG